MKIVSMSRDVVYDVLRERDANAVSGKDFRGRYAASPCEDFEAGPVSFT